MIVVRIECWPAGNPRLATELHRLLIVNDGSSPDPAVGHYDVFLAQPDRRPASGWRCVAVGRIHDFARRRWDAVELVRLALARIYSVKKAPPLFHRVLKSMRSYDVYGAEETSVQPHTPSQGIVR